ncbi:unnamed protein product [Didymodactylos carnosus]|uniref:RlpA-like protein double-psi beta-barrel domain-containing protein n=1 Tax=Didymodactylos carnosus TaxID=1234261 RepID=A0A816BRX0_9BILA|nr:unnamed protein product [Didymodactylos carnosus]CAF1612610.1 unnamed protein product [Didymodactylos carnosus]CAF3971195.1 unnamed protein product [Didymodactylos carnosus]CAF4496829.1 unnamed protein product [Didymodactylos carnosus]
MYSKILPITIICFVIVSTVNAWYTGNARWANLEGGYTACGRLHVNTDLIAGLNAAQFDPSPDGNPNKNSNCGKHVQVYGPRGSVTVIISDRCAGCAYGDLNLTPTAFQTAVGDLSVGRAQISWRFV